MSNILNDSNFYLSAKYLFSFEKKGEADVSGLPFVVMHWHSFGLLLNINTDSRLIQGRFRSKKRDFRMSAS